MLLAAAALGTSWWTIDISESGGSGSVAFYPSGPHCSASGSTSCVSTKNATYSKISHGLESLYLTVLLGGVAALLAGIAAFGYLVNGSLGRASGRRDHSVGLGLAVLAGLLLVVLPGLVLVVQPSTLNTPTAFGTFQCPSGPGTPAKSFWGSCSDPPLSFSWGAGPGWYLSIAGSGAICAGLLLYRTARRDPFTREELARANAPSPPPPLVPPAGSPPSP